MGSDGSEIPVSVIGVSIFLVVDLIIFGAVGIFFGWGFVVFSCDLDLFGTCSGLSDLFRTCSELSQPVPPVRGPKIRPNRLKFDAPKAVGSARKKSDGGQKKSKLTAISKNANATKRYFPDASKSYKTSYYISH